MIKNPVLLPSKHSFVTLLIHRAHELTKHSRVNQTLTLLRERYWVLKGHQVNHNIVQSCVTCRRIEGPHIPQALHLIFHQKDFQKICFSHTGVDFAESLYLNDSHEPSDHQKNAMYVFYMCSNMCCSFGIDPRHGSRELFTSFALICQLQGSTCHIDFQ